MPHILINTRVFLPEIHPTAVMVGQLAKRLALDGWKVDVVTGFPSYPHGRIHEGYSRSLWQKEVANGVQVHRVWHPLSAPGSSVYRACEVGGKVVLGSLVGLTKTRPDLIITVGFPLLGAMTWYPVCRFHGAKLINVVYDIYPDIAIESGHLANRAAIGFARYLEQLHWKCADLHVVLSEGFRQSLITRGVPGRRIAVVPTWIDTSMLSPMSRNNAWRREKGISLDTKVVLYAGTIGRISAASTAVEAAALMRQRCDILFLFIGEGAEKVRAEQLSRDLHLTNVRFLPFQPGDRLAEVQATADVGLVTLSPGFGRTSLPSKMLGYMAAERPVVASVEAGSETALEITAGEFGVVVPPLDPKALATAISELVDDDARRRELGRSARRWAVAHHDREEVVSRYIDTLSELAAQRGRGARHAR